MYIKNITYHWLPKGFTNISGLWAETMDIQQIMPLDYG